MNNYRNHLVLRKVFIKVIPLSPILFNLFINFIFNKCGKYGISIGNRQCFGGLSPTRFQFKKLLKFASKWARNNEMQFGINKCASLVVVREEVSRFLNNNNCFKKMVKLEMYYLLIYLEIYRVVDDMHRIKKVKFCQTN
jgi:hypothetical protein